MGLDRPRGSTDVRPGDGNPLMRAGPSIEEKQLTGHKARLGGREVDDRAGNVLHGAETSERRARDLHIAKAWVLAHSLAGQVGLDETRPDRIHGDPTRRELERQGFRQCHDATFSRAVRDALDPAQGPPMYGTLITRPP